MNPTSILNDTSGTVFARRGTCGDACAHWCLAGTEYGPCDWPSCDSQTCDYIGPCPCECHQEGEAR